VPPAHPEIIRTKLLIAQSKMLADAHQHIQSGVVQEIERAHELMAMSAELLSVEVQNALLSLPADGTWAPGVGPYYETINDMLDNRSLLIEEEDLPEDGDGPWRVRLSRKALKLMA
jgi:hypothetical protein